jgi:hypothetical protein
MNHRQCRFYHFGFLEIRVFLVYFRNQVTPQDTIIYLIVKITVLITEPAQMDVVLRKRIAVTINKSEGWWPEKTFKNLLGYVRMIMLIFTKKKPNFSFLETSKTNKCSL